MIQASPLNDLTITDGAARPENPSVPLQRAVPCPPLPSHRPLQCDTLSLQRFYRQSGVKKRAQAKIHISVCKQRLTLKLGRGLVGTYPISTSRFGLGTEAGTMK